MSTSKFITNKGDMLCATPPMGNDLLIPDLDELETVTEEETSASSDESFDMPDYTLYM